MSCQVNLTKGFSLVEVVVAMLLSSIVLLMTIQSFLNTQAILRRPNENLNDLRVEAEIRRILLLWRKEHEQIIPLPGMPPVSIRSLSFAPMLNFPPGTQVIERKYYRQYAWEPLICLPGNTYHYSNGQFLKITPEQCLIARKPVVRYVQDYLVAGDELWRCSVVCDSLLQHNVELKLVGGQLEVARV